LIANVWALVCAEAALRGAIPAEYGMNGAKTSQNSALAADEVSHSVLQAGFATALGKAALSSEDADFLRQAGDDWRPGEAPDAPVGDLLANLAKAWRIAGDANPDRAPLVELTPGHGEALPVDLLVVVQPDKPFLVDSVMGELADGGFAVRAMFHPVVTLHGRETSVILVMLEPVGEDRQAALIEGVKASLADAALAVADFPAMLALMAKAAAELEISSAPDGAYGKGEYTAFLKWLSGDRFVFLGARTYAYPRLANGDYAAEEPKFGPDDGLGVLRDPTRSVLRRASEPAVLASGLSAYLEHAAPLVVAKSNLRSRVHRRTYMDYIGVKRYDADGRAFGEIRFVGLFTAEAYDEPAHGLPLIRRKIENVLRRAGENPSAHNEKRLRNIVESYPRDELFQIEEDDLFEISTGILHLSDRPRVRLFARTDPFDRFVSVLLYIPRDRYDQNVRDRAGKILAQAYGGRVSAVYLTSTDQPLSRLHFIIGVSPGEHSHPDIPKIEAEIAEQVRTWSDRFDAAARAGGVAPGRVGELLARYAQAFPAGYRDRYSADEALDDLHVMETLGAGDDTTLRIRAYRKTDDSKLSFHIKLYRGVHFVPLADVLPILESMGLKALTEDGFAVKRQGADGAVEKVWIHEFEVEDEHGEHLVFDEVKAPFEDAFQAIWTGRTESDGFNRLVLELGVSWREAALIRAFARYRQQSGLDPSQGVQEQALSAYPGVSRLILDLFRTKFDPAIKADIASRDEQAEATFAKIVEALQDVASADFDRVLRRIALVVRAMKRTNYYQTGPDGEPKPYISFKIGSRELDDLPAPKPFREIFVWSPRVEGVHLRFGPVARGGLRWSDRRDDFRTEVLGLVKAQQVKNAVIVPVGAKGGFFPKHLPRGGTPDATRAEAVEAYKTFLSGLLDITDNLDAAGAVIHPEAVIMHEGDDPYLVVAADKGTATFSDIANGVAGDYGFWLGDAFASGGSHGYDHKAMGITARGAWEAVKRHFREAGKDIQTEPFTVVGVGDMSGDVFGNGMLLSKATKLVAAFDHRHIFLDPDPDPATSWNERNRMFALPRSSWEDYDKSLISTGGGVYPRGAKTVPVSPEVAKLLEITAGDTTPAELMRAILKARVELLYLGGIGTYVKAPTESNADVSDKANDAIRIDGAELRVQVVGEGANLGLTQAGRIAFARTGGPEGKGGRINTDAIDNSAGVDTSDHEVNIKILTNSAERLGDLQPADRDPLLVEMTEAVGHHVLAHNYAQTLALSLQEASAATELDAQGRFMLDLEARGRLDRKVEGLPRAAAIIDLRAAGRGLTRPELAVLTAYGKLELSDEVVDSTAPDDPYFEKALVRYFPEPLAKFENEMRSHRLRRDIIATVIANTVVDMTGPTFASRLRSAAGCDTAALVVAFEAARQMFRLDEVWRETGALDLKVPAATQLMLYQEIAGVLRGQTFWLARHAKVQGSTVQGLINAYRPTADALQTGGAAILSPFERDAVAERTRRFMAAGAPEALAATVAALGPMTAAVNIADLAQASGLDPVAAGRLYHTTGGVFGFDRLRAAAAAIRPADPYERQALRGLIVGLMGEQFARARAIAVGLSGKTPDAAETAVEAWIAPRRAAVERAGRTLAEIEDAAEGWSFAKLTIANAAVREAGAE
jgi:glutamate dehydrogenase